MLVLLRLCVFPFEVLWLVFMLENKISKSTKKAAGIGHFVAIWSISKKTKKKKKTHTHTPVGMHRFYGSLSHYFT